MPTTQSRDKAPCARLLYTPPFDWNFFLVFHRARALPGVESVEQQADRVAIRMRASETGAEVLLDDMMHLGCRIRMFQPEAMDMETAFMKLTEGKTA